MYSYFLCGLVLIRDWLWRSELSLLVLALALMEAVALYPVLADWTWSIE